MDPISLAHPAPIRPDTATANNVSSHPRDAPAEPSTVHPDPGESAAAASCGAPANSNPSPRLASHASHEHPPLSRTTPDSLPPPTWSFDSIPQHLHILRDPREELEHNATPSSLTGLGTTQEHSCQDEVDPSEQRDEMASTDAQNVSKGDEGMSELSQAEVDARGAMVMDGAALRMLAMRIGYTVVPEASTSSSLESWLMECLCM